MDDEQFLQMFLDEAEDQITTMNQNLLDLEQDSSDNDAISEMFRMAHSMKGAAATMGFSNITTLTHRMETLLDRFRTGELTMDSDFIDVFFECLDRIEGLVNEVNEISTDDGSIEDIISILENAEVNADSSATASSAPAQIPPQAQEDLPPENPDVCEPAETLQTPPDAQPPLPATSDPCPAIVRAMSPEDLETLKSQIDAGNLIIEISIETDESEGMAGARALIAMAGLQEIGDVMAHHPDPESDEADDCTFFNFLVATDAEKSEITDCAGEVGIASVTLFPVADIIDDLISQAASKPPQSSVLIIGDSKYQRFKMKKILQETGLEVHEAADPIDGLYMYRKIMPDLVLLDLIMPRMEGIEALKHLRDIDHNAKVIIYSAIDHEEIALQAMKSGAQDYLVKLSDIKTTLLQITNAINTTVSINCP